MKRLDIIGQKFNKLLVVASEKLLPFLRAKYLSALALSGCSHNYRVGFRTILPSWQLKVREEARQITYGINHRVTR